MIDPPFIEGEGMPFKIRTDADENRGDVTVHGSRTASTLGTSLATPTYCFVARERGKSEFR
jgi:hypothetical protein